MTVHNVTKDVYGTISQAANKPQITDPNFDPNDIPGTMKDLEITVEGVNITGNVYGGGNQAGVTGGSHVQVGPEP